MQNALRGGANGTVLGLSENVTCVEFLAVRQVQTGPKVTADKKDAASRLRPS
ncbi:hypothetical protein [Stenotrophomonas sp.]|uniref:hypothetical protein n=1 Tax=Stenotrophomonas sp. TaxID=69392 RepID=UPI0028983449|nr:hypothetical protein [Stenotrophomonas sp.]